jgi:hypothetical protein
LKGFGPFELVGQDRAEHVVESNLKEARPAAM